MTTEEILHSNLTDEQYAAVIDDSRNILCLPGNQELWHTK